MSALRRYGPLATALGTAVVLILRAFGLGEVADLLDAYGADVVAALVLLGGVVLKVVALVQGARARRDTVGPR